MYKLGLLFLALLLIVPGISVEKDYTDLVNSLNDKMS